MEEQTIDLRELVGILLQKARTIAKITGACIALAVLYLLIAPPVYQSDALLRIKQQQGLGSSLLDAATGGNIMATKQTMSTYAEILKSRSVVEPVIVATEPADDDGKYPGYDGYVKRITTAPFKDTEILKVSVNANTAEAAQTANAKLISTFMDCLTELSRVEQRATKEFLLNRTAEAKVELDKAEGALQDYKAQYKILSPEENVKIFAERLALMDKTAAENQINLHSAQARLAAVNEQLGGAAMAMADNAAITQYNTQLASLEINKMEYANKYTAKHPKMVETDKEIEALKGKIAQEIAKVAQMQAPSANGPHTALVAAKFASESEIAVAQGKAAALAALKDSGDKELEELPLLEQGYVRVARDAQVAAEIYIMLAKRLEEAKVAEVMVANDVQIVDTATLPERPVAPRKAVTLLAAALLGFLGGCGLVLAQELLNRRVRTEEDLKALFGEELPILGTIPEEASLHAAMAKRDAEPSGLLDKFLDKFRG